MTMQVSVISTGFRPFPRKEIEALRSGHKYNSIILGSITGGKGGKGKK